MRPLDQEQLMEFFREVFPQASQAGFEIHDIAEDSLTLRLECGDRHLRPGGTVSGPTFMWLADCAFYLALLNRIGKVALAVTTNLNINFMRKAGPGTIYAEARILKLGKSLAVGDVLLTAEAVEGAVAHATCTYSIPPGT